MSHNTYIRSNPPPPQDLHSPPNPPSPHHQPIYYYTPSSIPSTSQPIPPGNAHYAQPTPHPFPSSHQAFHSPSDPLPAFSQGTATPFLSSNYAPNASHPLIPTSSPYNSPAIYPPQQTPQPIPLSNSIHYSAQPQQSQVDSHQISTALRCSADSVANESPVAKGLERGKKSVHLSPPRILNFTDNPIQAAQPTPSVSAGLTMSSPLRREVERSLAAHAAESIGRQSHLTPSPLPQYCSPIQYPHYPETWNANPPLAPGSAQPYLDQIPVSTQMCDAGVTQTPCLPAVVQVDDGESIAGDRGQEHLGSALEAKRLVNDDKEQSRILEGEQAPVKAPETPPPDNNRVLRRGRSRGVALRSAPMRDSSAHSAEQQGSDSGEAPVPCTQLSPPTPTHTENDDDSLSWSVPFGGKGANATSEGKARKDSKPRKRLKPAFENDSDFEDPVKVKPPLGTSKTRRQVRRDMTSKKKRQASDSSPSHRGKKSGLAESSKRSQVGSRTGRALRSSKAQKNEDCNSTRTQLENRTEPLSDDDEGDFIQEKRDDDRVKASLRRSPRKCKKTTAATASDEQLAPPPKRRLASKNSASPTKTRSSNKAEAKPKRAKTAVKSVFGDSPSRISLKPLGSQDEQSRGASEATNDGQSPSQGRGSQTMEIVVEALPMRKKRKGRRYAERLYRTLTEDDLSLIRQAFTKVYKTPPSNARVHGCYEFDRGQQMTEEMKKQVWEKDLKPWSDKWWQLYQDFGKIGRSIKKAKEAKDIKPDLNMRELAQAAKKFREEHGEIRPEKISYIM